MSANYPPGDLEPRPEDDDYDLLTFGEAGARLVEEIRRQQRIVEELSVSGASEQDQREADGRLTLLREAQIRNKKPTLSELRERGFFGPRS
jgi:hypothetical protein